MIELLGTIFEFVKDIISLGITVAFDVVDLVFGLLGGLFSFLLGVGGIIVAVVLIRHIIKRRRKYKEDTEKVFVDENGEEFVSYYRQDN